jgi:hypothetical protein
MTRISPCRTSSSAAIASAGWAPPCRAPIADDLDVAIGRAVKVVSERLGHASVAFTQDTYMHVIPGMDEHGAQVAAAAIFGLQPGKEVESPL